MKIKYIVILLLFPFNLILSQENNAPVVTNVTFGQRTDGSFIVDVYYDLSDADNDTMTVTMKVSDDAGANWNFSCQQISGDVGADITSGTSKHIVWDFGAEHPQTFGEQFQIKIIADDNFLETGTVTDIDGNVYKTVKISDQWWMAENLKVTHFRNGDEIQYRDYGGNLPFYCNYENNELYVDIYGCLYNWYAAADNRNIAPEGWHVPTIDDWQILITYLGGNSIAGGKMKETDTLHWASPNPADNLSGFTGLPAGMNTNQGFVEMSYIASFWYYTEWDNNYAWNCWLRYHTTGIVVLSSPKDVFNSVRCVKD